jgi:tetratricopeptide (TPR) repeat protein
MARPELLDVRPAWAGGKLNATNVLLEPLVPEETARLVDLLADEVEPGLRERILEAAGGNPLFVEEMLAMAAEGGADVVVPPTIQALLAARLDQLDGPERGVLERGAVEGQVFHRTAVAALADGGPVDSELVALVRKDLVRPEKPLLPDDDAYRFRHLLIRDTAYEALPKATRAELHERLADWLQEHGATLVELDEILGYHLEQAFRYRAELGPLDDGALATSERAGERLLASADRALDRGDASAAIGLLGRAIELLPDDDPRRPPARLELVKVLGEQVELERALALLEEVAAEAREAGDERMLGRTKLAQLDLDTQVAPDRGIAEALVEAQEVLADLERIGDEEGALWALRLIGALTGWLGRTAEAHAYWRRAIERAEGKDSRYVNDVLGWMLLNAWWGPMPIEEAIRFADEVVATTSSKRLEAYAQVVRGVGMGVDGRLDEGREELAAGRALLRDLGDLISSAGLSAAEAELELAAGNPERAYRACAEGAETLASSAASGYLTTIRSLQGFAALDLGRDEEALRLTEEARSLAADGDVDPRSRDWLIRARLAAKHGDFAEADELLAVARNMIEPTDFAHLKIDFTVSWAEVARLAGRREEERAAFEEMLGLAEAKGNALVARHAVVALANLDS